MTRRHTAGPSTMFERLARRSASMTLEQYVLIEPFLTRPISLGPRRAASPVPAGRTPAATRTTPAQRALLDGHDQVSVGHLLTRTEAPDVA